MAGAIIEIVYRKPRLFADVYEYDDNIQDIDLFPTAVGFRTPDSTEEMIEGGGPRSNTNFRYEVLKKEVGEVVVEVIDNRQEEHDYNNSVSKKGSSSDCMGEIREGIDTNSTVQSSESSYQSEILSKENNDDKSLVRSVVNKSDDGTLSSIAESQQQSDTIVYDDDTTKLQDEKKKNDTSSLRKSDCSKSIEIDDGGSIIYEHHSDDRSPHVSCVSCNASHLISDSLLMSSSTFDNVALEKVLNKESATIRKYFTKHFGLFASWTKLDNAALEAVLNREGATVRKHFDLFASLIMCHCADSDELKVKEPAAFRDRNGADGKEIIQKSNSSELAQHKNNNVDTDSILLLGNDGQDDKLEVSDEENQPNYEVYTEACGTNISSKMRRDCSLDGDGGISSSTSSDTSFLVQYLREGQIKKEEGKNLDDSQQKVSISSSSLGIVEIDHERVDIEEPTDKEALIYPLMVEV